MSVEKMMAELGLEEEEFREVTETFMDIALSELELLKTAVRMGAAPEAADYAHSIKGAALGMGFQEISDTARTV